MQKLLLLIPILLIVQNIFAQFEESIPSKAVIREFSEIDSKNKITVTILFKYDKLNDIDKNNFARLVETLPDKSECTFVEVANAETNRTLNVLKFYWDSKKLPKEDFTIKYILTINPRTADKCIEGEFGYIDKSNNIGIEEIGGTNCFEQ